MKRLLLVVAALLVSSWAQATEVLLVDSVQVEVLSKVVARLRAEAGAAQDKKSGTSGSKLDHAHAEALEMALSELRGALPEVVEALAKTRKADLVLEPEVAKRLQISGTELTVDVAKALDLRFAKLKFIGP